MTTDEAVLERGLVGLTHTGGHHRWVPSNLDRPGDSAEHHADRQQRSKSSTSGGCHQSADTAQVVSCDLVAATAALRVAARAAREGWHPKKPGPLLPTRPQLLEEIRCSRPASTARRRPPRRPTLPSERVEYL